MTTRGGETHAVERSGAMNFARAILHKPRNVDDAVLVPYTFDAQRAPSADAEPLKRTGGTEDIMDSTFVAFHRELRAEMLDAHGLLAHSEAHMLHDVVVAALEFWDDDVKSDRA